MSSMSSGRFAGQRHGVGKGAAWSHGEHVDVCSGPWKPVAGRDHEPAEAMQDQRLLQVRVELL